MKSIELTITNDVGLHARPAALFVQTANRFEATVIVTLNESSTSAKSLLGLLSLGISKGTRIEVSADGADEQEALTALQELVDNNFGEESQSGHPGFSS